MTTCTMNVYATGAYQHEFPYATVSALLLNYFYLSFDALSRTLETQGELCSARCIKQLRTELQLMKSQLVDITQQAAGTGKFDNMPTDI